MAEILTKRRMNRILRRCTHFFGSSPSNFSNKFDLVAYDDAPKTNITDYGSELAEHMRVKEFTKEQFVNLWFESHKHFIRQRRRHSRHTSEGRGAKREAAWDGGCYVIVRGDSTFYK